MLPGRNLIALVFETSRRTTGTRGRQEMGKTEIKFNIYLGDAPYLRNTIRMFSHAVILRYNMQRH